MSSMAELEERFHLAAVDLYNRAKREFGYNGARYLQRVHELGGVDAAKELLASPDMQSGLMRLWEEKRLDLSIEALVVVEPWRELFSSDQIAAAERNLRSLEYPLEAAHVSAQHVELFMGDDEAYQYWLHTHQDGFVLNVRRTMDPVAFSALHRASCSRIRGYTGVAQEGGFTERQYVKVCADRIAVLREWVRERGAPAGRFTLECAHCEPE